MFDLTKFELLSDFKFGFRKFHSTATALLGCTNVTRLFADDTNLTASGKSTTEIEAAVNADWKTLENG